MSLYIRRLNFSSDLWSLYPPEHFLSPRESGIIAITNRNGDSASPWKIPAWIFTSVKLIPPDVSSTLQFSAFFLIYLRGAYDKFPDFFCIDI